MPRKEIPPQAAKLKVVGPYSTVVKFGDEYQFSGILPEIDPQNGHPMALDFETQVRQVLEKARTMLEICGLTPNDLWKVDIRYIGEMEEFATLNALYREFLEGVEIAPARVALPKRWILFDAKIEIWFTAVKQTT
ncbi:MAG: RidA family protein [Patescibacteria group bacterium]|jgi:enamine deaminase RidA (YjgF/YER057c/UK114 family)